MTYFPAHEFQIGSLLDQKAIDAIIKATSDANVEISGSNGFVLNTRNQHDGECLVVTVTDSDKPTAQCFSVDIPMALDSARSMFSTGFSAADFLEAIKHKNQKVVGTYLVMRRLLRGVTLDNQALDHQTMIEMNVLDLVLVVVKSRPDRFVLCEMTFEDRTDLPEQS